LAALPIWMEFMDKGMAGMPAVEFANVVSLEDQAAEHNVHVDVPDTRPEEEVPLPKPNPPVLTSTPVPPGH
jgi:hypothetical protein